MGRFPFRFVGTWEVIGQVLYKTGRARLDICSTLDAELFAGHQRSAQETVTLSSAEAEYVVATSATCQAVWMRRILEDLHQSQSSATELFCDNKVMAKNPVFHGHTKHIEIKHNFIRQAIANGTIELKHCSTMDQVADGFTKAL
ncbi:hypothetical protein MRB53_006260 [Persea americana]|uniref:Uncharacterized protein n=1 Tax=Persea americana TaxID=3435 RepID=A0ACC2MFM6_PERAE|nr:hypothetical protein MRB53_006260 [Persea americana]